MIFNIQIHNYFCFCSLQFPNLILLSQVQGNQYLLLLQVRIGSIGTASFYGGAAAARPHPHAQPGEFHVIVHLILVLLVFVISSMILT